MLDLFRALRDKNSCISKIVLLTKMRNLPKNILMTTRRTRIWTFMLVGTPPQDKAKVFGKKYLQCIVMILTTTFPGHLEWCNTNTNNPTVPHCPRRPKQARAEAGAGISKFFCQKIPHLDLRTLAKFFCKTKSCIDLYVLYLLWQPWPVWHNRNYPPICVELPVVAIATKGTELRSGTSNVFSPRN